MPHNLTREKAVDVAALSLNKVPVTATADQLNALAGPAFDRVAKVAKVALSGTAIHAGVVAWLNPESSSILIERLVVDVTTVATAAGTLSAGSTSTSAATASANLIDTADVHSATGALDNITDKGTLGKSRQKIAAGKWVTFSEASGSVAGLVGNAYIHYVVA